MVLLLNAHVYQDNIGLILTKTSLYFPFKPHQSDNKLENGTLNKYISPRDIYFDAWPYFRCDDLTKKPKTKIANNYFLYHGLTSSRYRHYFAI